MTQLLSTVDNLRAQTALRVSRLSREESAELRQQAICGDMAARERLIYSCLPWAISLAKRYESAKLPMDDLRSLAMVGLIEAVDSWIPERGQLTTWTAVHVKKQICQEATTSRTIIKVPHGNISERTRAHFEQARHGILSLDCVSTEQRESIDCALSERVPITEDLVIEADEKASNRQTLQLLFTVLPDQVQRMLQIRVRDVTLQRIADCSGCCLETARSRWRVALKSIRILLRLPTEMQKRKAAQQGELGADIDALQAVRQLQSSDITERMWQIRRRLRIFKRRCQAQLAALDLLKQVVAKREEQNGHPTNHHDYQDCLLLEILWAALEEHGALTVKMLSRCCGLQPKTVTRILLAYPELFVKCGCSWRLQPASKTKISA